MAQTAVPDTKEIERDRVIEWRYTWLVAAGYSKRNAKLIATDVTLDWRYANTLLRNATAKGYDESFVMGLLF